MVITSARTITVLTAAMHSVPSPRQCHLLARSWMIPAADDMSQRMKRDMDLMRELMFKLESLPMEQGCAQDLDFCARLP